MRSIWTWSSRSSFDLDSLFNMFAYLVVRLQRKVAPFTRSFLSLQLLQALTPQTWSPAEAKTCNLALFWSQNSIETRGVKLLTSIFHHAPGADYQIEILDVIFHFLSIFSPWWTGLVMQETAAILSAAQDGRFLLSCEQCCRFIFCHE